MFPRELMYAFRQKSCSRSEMWRVCSTAKTATNTEQEDDFACCGTRILQVIEPNTTSFRRLPSS
jgi:hypothetical protein